MKEKLWAVFFALLVCIAGYIMVSSANKHIARDNEDLYHWAMSWADRR